MREDQWKEIYDRVRSQFDVVEEGEEALEDVPDGKIRFVEFEGPLGYMRLECVSKPRTLGERAQATRRTGATTRVEILYDSDDIVTFLRAFQWNDSDQVWSEIRTDALTTWTT